MIYAEPERARGRSFHGLLAYILHDLQHASTSERVMFTAMLNLLAETFDIAADEMRDIVRRTLVARRTGQRPDNLAFHFILSWHQDDHPTAAHMIETARSALAALGLGEHQAVIAGHDDTDEPHVHVAVNIIHPETGIAAKLGWRHKAMSRWAAAYEREQGVIRCPKRFIPKAANERRKRLTEAEWQRRKLSRGKQKASKPPAPRP
ncbi:MAG: relaxase/mobilization nuclease domain-containing protein [Micropepsaceae bacterium]